MSVTYRISPEELHPAGMAALQRGFDCFGIDFYIIGAVARDIWLSQVHEEPIRRIAKDLDLAVLLNDSAQYEALQVWLTEKECRRGIAGGAAMVMACSGSSYNGCRLP